MSVSPRTQGKSELLTSIPDNVFSPLRNLSCPFVSLLPSPGFITAPYIPTTSLAGALVLPLAQKSHQVTNLTPRCHSTLNEALLRGLGSSTVSCCFTSFFSTDGSLLYLPLFSLLSIICHFLPFFCFSITIYPETLPAVLCQMKTSE